MSIAYWCILIAAVLPYAWVAFAKSGAPAYNNKDPRGWLAKQPPSPPSAEPARYALHNLRLEGGRIHYLDAPLGQQRGDRDLGRATGKTTGDEVHDAHRARCGQELFHGRAG